MVGTLHKCALESRQTKGETWYSKGRAAIAAIAKIRCAKARHAAETVRGVNMYSSKSSNAGFRL